MMSFVNIIRKCCVLILMILEAFLTKRMVNWRIFHSISEDLAFAFGFTLNTLLLILIMKIKVKSMQQYNILLFQCCCVDMFQVVISFIVKPIVVVYENNEYYLTNGFLRPIGGGVEMLGFVLWGSSVFFCICSMTVSFIFRYITICLEGEISKKFYIISLIVAFLSASSYGVLVWKFYYIDYGHMTYLAEEKLSWLMADDEGKVDAIAIGFIVSYIFFKIRNI